MEQMIVLIIQMKRKTCVPSSLATKSVASNVFIQMCSQVCPSHYLYQTGIPARNLVSEMQFLFLDINYVTVKITVETEATKIM